MVVSINELRLDNQITIHQHSQVICWIDSLMKEQNITWDDIQEEFRIQKFEADTREELLNSSSKASAWAAHLAASITSQ